MKNIIKILISIFIIATIIVLLVLLGKNKGIKNREIEKNIQLTTEPSIKTFQRTTNTKDYFTVDKYIKAYMSGLKSKQEDLILSYLNENYLSSFKYDDKNIFEIMELYDNYDSYITLEMYELNTNNYTEYNVKSKIDGKYIYFIVGLDKSNMTFDIYPIKETEYLNKISEQIQIEKYENKAINDKKYNYFNYINIDSNEEIVARLYYSEYIKMMLVDPKEAYNYLDKEYKDAKFETYDKFENYINENKEDLQIAYRLETSNSTDFENFNEYYNYKQNNDYLTIKNYSVEKNDEYTQYICADGYNHYYIFNVKYPGEYKAFLDSYTVKPLKFTEKYNSMSNKEKVATNCNIFIQMLNSRDYEKAYQVLDATFKQNTFENIDAFKKYVIENLYGYNIVSNSYEIEQINNYYSCEFTIQNKDSKKTFNIIMELKEDTDFVMSFSV